MIRCFTFLLVLISLISFGQKAFVIGKVGNIERALQFLDGHEYWIFGSEIGYIDLTQDTWNELNMEDILGSYLSVKKFNEKIYILGNRYVDSLRKNKGYFVCLDKEGNTLINISLDYLINNHASFVPSILMVSDSTVYFVGKDNEQNQYVWSSKGTESSTKKYTNGDTIIHVAFINERISFASYQDSSYYLNQIIDDSITRYKVPTHIPEVTRILYETVADLYFGVKVPFPINSELWAYNKVSGQFRKIKDGAYDAKLDHKSPWGIIENPKTFRSNYAPVYLTKETGFELAYNFGDTFIIDDFNAGPGSSIIRNYEIQTEPILYKDSLYAILTNGNDVDYYLYQLSENGKKECVIEINKATSVIKPFIFQNHLYWWDYENSYNKLRNLSIQLWKKSLNDREIQPIVRSLKSEWYRQVTLTSTTTSLSSDWLFPIQTEILNDKSVVMSLFSGNSRGFNYQLHDQVSYDSTKRGGDTYLVKYDSLGQRLWTLNYGALRTNLLSTNSSNFSITNDGHIILSGDVFQGVYWESEFEDYEGSIVKRYLAKVDGKSGKILWRKEFLPTRYISPYRTDKMVLDSDNNIYITAMYEDFSLSLEGLSINSNKSPVNVLLKYNPSGKLIWMKNIETPWLDVPGFTKVLEYNKKNDKIVAIQGNGKKGYVQHLDLDGNVLHTNSISSTGSVHFASGGFDSKGDFYGYGYASGAVTLENFEFQSTPSDATNGFSLTCSNKEGNITSVANTNNKNLKVLSAVIENDNRYILCRMGGSFSSSKVVVIKLDLAGTYLGHKLINQRISDEFLHYNNLAVKDDKIVVSSKFQSDESSYGIQNTIFPYGDNLPFVSLLYINNDNWSTDSTWFIPIQTDLSETKAEFKVYPNPFMDNVTVVLPGSSHSYTNYAIYDMKGAEINSGTLTSEQVQTLNLSYLNQGVFVLKCFNNEDAIAVKLIKM